MSLVGYYRIFLWKEETLEERNAFRHLFDLGCSPVCIERLNHDRQKEYPVFDRMMEDIKAGDTIYVWKFAHLANSLNDLIQVVQQIEQNEVGLVIAKQGIYSDMQDDLKISEILKMGKRVILEMTRESTNLGLLKARKEGRLGGRPPLPNSTPLAIAAENLYLNTELPISEITQILNIAKPTLYNYLKKRGIRCGR